MFEKRAQFGPPDFGVCRHTRRSLVLGNPRPPAATRSVAPSPGQRPDRVDQVQDHAAPKHAQQIPADPLREDPAGTNLSGGDPPCEVSPRRHGFRGLGAACTLRLQTRQEPLDRRLPKTTGNRTNPCLAVRRACRIRCRYCIQRRAPAPERLSRSHNSTSSPPIVRTTARARGFGSGEPTATLTCRRSRTSDCHTGETLADSRTVVAPGLRAKPWIHEWRICPLSAMWRQSPAAAGPGAFPRV